MAYLDDAQDALDEAYAEFGVSAVWTPSGGEPQPVTLMPDTADGEGAIPGIGRTVVSRNVYSARASELALAGLTPARGDMLQVGPALLKVQAPPVRKGSMQLEWKMECS